MERLHRGQRKQRLTLVTTVPWIIAVLIAGSATLMVLSNSLGVAPVLASVDVVGLALSLGTQTPTKDAISGLFVMVEK